MGEDGTVKSFEARVFAVLDQVQAEQKAQRAQLIGVAAIGLLCAYGLSKVGKELAGLRP